MDSHCAECGQPLLWGGMSWVPHTDAHHRARRRILMHAVHRRLREELFYRGIARDAAAFDGVLVVWRIVLPHTVLYYTDTHLGGVWEDIAALRPGILADQARELRDNIEIEHGIRPHPMRVRYRVLDERGKMSHRCPECDNPTVYQPFSGGTEWYCETCDTNGAYPAGQTPRRVGMLKTEAGRDALRTEMREELARLRHKEGN